MCQFFHNYKFPISDCVIMAPMKWLAFWFLAFLAVAGADAAPIYSVTSYGAKGDGNSYDNQAFLGAWNEACRDPGAPTFLVPSGMTFLLGQAIFSGPCQSSMHVQIDGTIFGSNQVWDSEVEHNHWITISDVNGLVIDGSGEIDGRGAVWWECIKDEKCSEAPNGLFINHCSNVHLSGLKFINSPRMHVSIHECFGVLVSGLIIEAPGDSSPNTDGIHIQNSRNVSVSNCIIGTGDDCISIGTNVHGIHISWINCGPGHGISIGSLGEDESEAKVEHVKVSHCNFFKTTNGARIKTWQGGSGYARNIAFKHINFTDVENPIIIDQFYCDRDGHNCPKKTSAVQVSEVLYSGLAGTSSTDIAINIKCSETVACTGIAMDNVFIQPTTPGTIASAYCLNAHGTTNSIVVPAVPCLTV